MLVGFAVGVLGGLPLIRDHVLRLADLAAWGLLQKKKKMAAATQWQSQNIQRGYSQMKWGPNVVQAESRKLLKLYTISPTSCISKCNTGTNKQAVKAHTCRIRNVLTVLTLLVPKAVFYNSCWKAPKEVMSNCHITMLWHEMYYEHNEKLHETMCGAVFAQWLLPWYSIKITRNNQKQVLFYTYSAQYKWVHPLLINISMNTRIIQIWQNWVSWIICLAHNMKVRWIIWLLTYN